MMSILDLPLEMLDELAVDESSYRALLSIPKFARSITPSRRIDFMIKFGHRVHIDGKMPGIRWYKIVNNKRLTHRRDGPAVESVKSAHIKHNKIEDDHNGDSISKTWFINSKLHRDDGPAAIIENYMISYCRNGKYHRDNDLPAVINLHIARKAAAYFTLPNSPRLESPSAFWCIDGVQKEQPKWFKDLNPKEKLTQVEKWYKDAVPTYNSLSVTVNFQPMSLPPYTIEVNDA